MISTAYKTVAIVGAGPAGLASAKAMQEVGLVPRVFESAGTVGGLWSPASKLRRPSMRTNVSKYTCCFSDFPWPPNTPMFPTAVLVGEYLSSYAQRYLKPGVVSFGCKVTDVVKFGANDRWSITWSTACGQETAVFDYLILSCGFFSEPYIPSIPGLATFPGSIIHSSSYSCPETFKDKHVAVIGGSHSGVEIADDIALHAASVHHVIPRPFWVIPRYLPMDAEDSGTTFLPMDLVLFRRSSRSNINSSAQNQWREANEHLRSVCGVLSDFSDDMKIDVNSPPFTAVSDVYANFVRSDRIKLHTGHLTSVSGPNLHLTSQKPSSPLPCNITHIIFATGFRPSSVLDILPPSLLSALSVSQTDNYMPFLLHRATLHPSLPNAAFVGYYRGPFWGIIELQARWCAGLFSGALPWPSAREIQEGVDLENVIRDHRPRTQWPRGNYVQFGGDLANTIGTILPTNIPLPNLKRRSVRPEDVFVPHHFTRPFWLQPIDGQDVSGKSPSPLDCLELTLRGSANSALFVAAAVFRSLYGSWIINRTYTSRCSGYPSGHSTGTADFIFEKVSSATLFAQEKPSDTEYLYSEKTQMSSSTGTTFLGTRQYIYRYDEANDKLQVFFVNRGKEISLGHLFHEVDLELPLEEASSQISCSEKLPWRAKAIHHCSPDTYDVTYTFFFKGVDLSKWRVGYEVKGPKKDYSIETWYTR